MIINIDKSKGLLYHMHLLRNWNHLLNTQWHPVQTVLKTAPLLNLFAKDYWLAQSNAREVIACLLWFLHGNFTSFNNNLALLYKLLIDSVFFGHIILWNLRKLKFYYYYYIILKFKELRNVFILQTFQMLIHCTFNKQVMSLNDN